MNEKVDSKSEPVTKEPLNTDIPPRTESSEEDHVELFPGASSWLSAGSSWLTSAKQKTFNTIDLMKKDFSEFKDVMSTEVTDLTNAAKGGLDSTVNVVKQQAQYFEKLVTPDEEDDSKQLGSSEAPNSDLVESVEDASATGGSATNDAFLLSVEKSASMGFGWMKSLVDTVTDTVKNLAIEESAQGEDEFTVAIKPAGGRRTKLNHVKLLEIQTSESTYTSLPKDSETFESWIEHFSMDEHDGEINLLLSSNPPMRQIYTRLVPSILDSLTFWTRYFFVVEMAELDEEMAQEFTLQQLNVKTDEKSKSDYSIETRNNESPSVAKGSPDSDASLTVIDQPTSPAKSADDWSVCSEKNELVEDVSSSSTQSDGDETGPLTPKPRDENESGETGQQKEDGWVDWDE